MKQGELSMRMLLLLIGLCFAFNVQATTGFYNVDAAHSSIDFSIKHMFTKVKGSFDKFSGEFYFDEKNMDKSYVSLKIDSNSINTRNKKRDDHLKNKDFFNVKKYPEINFKSTKVKKKGSKSFEVMGELDMHGVKKPAKFMVSYLGTDKSPYGHMVSSFTANSEINRKDHKITWSKKLDSGVPLVGDEVTIELNIAGALDPKKSESIAKNK